VIQRVFDIIHPSRRNLTAIRGYVRLGGLPDDPRTDPQDRSWFGPHDRLFTEEESQPLNFIPGPDYGTSPFQPSIFSSDLNQFPFL
jgi:alpha-1,3-mannosyltransferase